MNTKIFMPALNTKEVITQIEEWGYKDIVLDFDKTIAHLVIDWAPFKIQVNDFALRRWIQKERESMNLHAFCEFIIEKYGYEWKKEIDKICETAESEHLLSIVINEGLVDFIKENSETYNFYILSNNMYSTLIHALKEIQIESYFVLILWRDSVSVPKPHPAWIEQIIEKQAGKKEDFVMIWDNPDSDIAAADRAGISSLLMDMYI